MIIIPELRKVLILVPRTGSGSLRRAVLVKYPRAMQLYRHMEADGVPRGYDTWERVGVLRNPLDRLWSLYKFIRGPLQQGQHDPAYKARMLHSAHRPFDEWLRDNTEIFTDGYTTGRTLPVRPQFMVNHPLPETRKSQWLYLRPDLGTTIVLYDNLNFYAQEHFDVTLGLHNSTINEPPPELSHSAERHMWHYFRWDMEMTQS